ncbi:MAG: hypothetical protein J6C85_06410 [Alphaproteobacteria bacterium]|nr:hypothetical protein [Alphaproteobacteria bacterium]
MADYVTLGNLIMKNPKAALSAFKSFKQVLKNDDSKNFSLAEAYKTLGYIIKGQPQLAKEVLDSFNVGLQNENNDKFSFMNAYTILGGIIEEQPQLAKEVLEAFKLGVQNEKNNGDSLFDAYENLRFIVEEQPQSAKEVLEIFNVGLQNENNNFWSVGKAYETLDFIVKAQPQSAKEVLELFNVGLQNKNNNYSSLEKAYEILDFIVKAQPQSAKEVLEIFNVGLQNENNNYSSLGKAYETLGDIVRAQPQSAKKVLESFNIGLQNKKNTYSSLGKAYETLGDIVRAKPELSKEITYLVLNSESLDCPEALKILSPCSKKAKLDELLSQVNENDSQRQEKTNTLKAAYALRFSTVDELKYVLDKEDNDMAKISQMRFSAQQRCMNVLMNELGKETGVSKEESMSYRLAPDDNDLYKNNKDWLLPASFKAAEIFGCYFPSYIKMAEKHLSIHDAVYWLPEKLHANKKDSFASFVQRNLVYMNAEGKTVARPLAEMEIISKNWNSLKPEEEKLKYKDILAICRSKKYAEQEYDRFAAEAAKWGVSEEQYKNFESVYKAGLSVPEPFDSSKEFKFGAYTGRFLPRDDVRTGFFGGYTDCCQHFDGVGKACAISTIKDPYSQLFVIENKDGRIISGSWVWENTEGKYRDVCFDNIEAIGDYEKNPVVNKIYDMVGKYLTNEASCHKVTIGVGYQDADISKYAPTESISLPQAYGDKYSDAKGQQVLLCENKHASELDKTAESKRFIRDICFLDEDAMDKVSEQCFPEGDQTLMMPDRPSGLALVDEYKGVVGYCLYDKDEKHIYDMAVLPEYRKDKNASSGKLFAETMRRVKELGGEWHAELRDKTTYRYLDVMAKRGLVTYETHGVDREMSDGSKVYAVSFKPVSDERTAKRESNVAPSLHGSTRE